MICKGTMICKGWIFTKTLDIRYLICVEGRAATLAWTACTSNGTNWRGSCFRLNNRGFEALTRHELCDVVHMKVVVHTAVGPRDLSLGVETLADSCPDASQPKLGFVVCFRCFGILNHLMTFIATPFWIRFLIQDGTPHRYLHWRAEVLASRGYTVLIADLLGDELGPQFCTY